HNSYFDVITRALRATDLGLAADTPLTALRGVVTEAGTTRIITVDYIKAEKHVLLPQLRGALPRMLAAARAQGVETLQIEARFANDILESFARTQVEAHGGTYISAGGSDIMTFIFGH